MPGSPYFDDVPKGILTWPILMKIMLIHFTFFMFLMHVLPRWWLTVFVTFVTISIHIWIATRPSKMSGFSSIDS